MNAKTIIAILAVVCVALGIAMIAIKSSNDTQHDKDVSSIVDFSNQVVNADQHIDSLNQVNLSLTNDLMLSQQQAAELSNDLATAAATLASTKASLQEQVDNLTNAIVEAFQGDNGSLLTLITETSVLAQSLAGPDDLLGGAISEVKRFGQVLPDHFLIRIKCKKSFVKSTDMAAYLHRQVSLFICGGSRPCGIAGEDVYLILQRDSFFAVLPGHKPDC